MAQRTAHLATPRQQKPELEHDFVRSETLGYEPPQEAGTVRCLAHGFPTPLARWHFHDEYELHLITATSGKAFVGDWIGPFEPGHLVLCGPLLPHNWISTDLPDDGVAERDLVIQFLHEPLMRAADVIPEVAALLPMLDRARHGIEFFGESDRALAHWRRVKARRGMHRIAAFCEFLADLAECTDYRLLSAVQMQGNPADPATETVNQIVQRIVDDLGEPIAQAALADELGMSQSQFSRWFRRATGNGFVDFVNRVRVNRACQLLSSGDRLVTQVCYEVGFNNVANFNRRFLEIKGMTPSEYRRQASQRFGGAR